MHTPSIDYLEVQKSTKDETKVTSYSIIQRLSHISVLLKVLF